MKKPNLEQAIELLKNAVTFSTIKGQKHLNLSLVNSADLPKYQIALMVTREEIKKNTISEEQLKIKLGLL